MIGRLIRGDWVGLFALLMGSALLLGGCSEEDTMMGSNSDAEEGGSYAVESIPEQAAPSEPLAEAGNTKGAAVYGTKLQPLGGSGVHGGSKLMVRYGSLSAQLTAEGDLQEGTHGQHIHVPGSNTACQFGGIAVPLDDNLSSNDFESFPATNPGGVLHYRQTTSDLGAVKEALDEDLHLEGFVVVVHAASEGGHPPGPPVACGVLQRVNK